MKTKGRRGEERKEKIIFFVFSLSSSGEKKKKKKNKKNKTNINLESFFLLFIIIIVIMVVSIFQIVSQILIIIAYLGVTFLALYFLFPTLYIWTDERIEQMIEKTFHGDVDKFVDLIPNYSVWSLAWIASTIATTFTLYFSKVIQGRKGGNEIYLWDFKVKDEDAFVEENSLLPIPWYHFREFVVVFLVYFLIVYFILDYFTYHNLSHLSGQMKKYSGKEEK